MILDLILNYFGISSFIMLSYIFIFNKSYLNIMIIALIMDLFYFKYFVIYLSLCYLIVKLIYKYIKSNIILDLIFLYFITLFYYLITVKIRVFKLIFLYSLLPCIFYFICHIMKYEMDKQNINSSNYYIGRFNRFKKK